MTELEKIAYAKSYIEKLANGINPLTNQEVPESDIINNVKISRCLFYVSDLLRQVVENKGISQSKNKSSKVPFQLDYESREKFEYSELPIPISEIERRINALIQPEEMKKLTYKQIADWLMETGFLKLVVKDDGKTVRRPTDQGIDIGISTEERQSLRGPYTVVVYNRSAQQFILEPVLKPGSCVQSANMVNS